MKIDDVFFETIASGADFYTWIKYNEKEFDFTRIEFHEGMNEHLFDEGKLSSRFDQEWCRNVIDKTNGAESPYWDKVRRFYPAILLFMQDYDLKTIRFVADW